MTGSEIWPRPVPLVGDASSSAERAANPQGWELPPPARDALYRVIAGRRDVRRFRPDVVPAALIERLLGAAHQAPSVGHSQPWRFVVVTEPATRARAAVLADRARLGQAGQMDEESARHLLDLDLEGIREAPVGLVVCCDRRAGAGGVLGRATFTDADMWSCACAIENLWLVARAEGLGVGWVTLFAPDELADLIGAPEGVATLGWLCVGWPDERPPAPGLERRGWSRRLPLDGYVLRERWPADPDIQPAPPVSRLVLPSPDQVVHARDTSDRILSAPGSLGLLDRAVDKLLALGLERVADGGGTLVLVAADHPVTALGVSAYPPDVTRHVAEAAVAGRSVGAVAAAAAGLAVLVVDAGVEGAPVGGARPIRPEGPRGDLVGADALGASDVLRLLTAGTELGRELAAGGVVALAEVGVGNTTVAAALAAALTGVDPDRLVGLGAGSDSAILAAKREVVADALARVRRTEVLGARPTGAAPHRAGTADPIRLLGALGGGEIAVLSGVTLGVAEAGGVVVVDGLATSVAALVAVEHEPAVAAHLVAGQRSREIGHPVVLEALGLEPLLDLRLRAGEGAGAAMAVGLLRSGLRVRECAARTAPGG